MLELKHCDLFYIENSVIFFWVKEDEFKEKNFLKIKKKWDEEKKKGSGFFLNTKILLVLNDTILLEVKNKTISSFMSENYDVKEQIICQKIFNKKKNIVLITSEQWKKNDLTGKSIVLLKDEEIMRLNLNAWLGKKIF